jgi:hypothetical protein
MPSRTRGRPKGKGRPFHPRSKRADLTDRAAEALKWPYPKRYDKPLTEWNQKAIDVWNRPRAGEPSFAEQERAYYAQRRTPPSSCPDPTETISRCGRVWLREDF